MLHDLDKLYLALAEVGADHHFNTFCYGLNITSLSDLESYNYSKDSFILNPDEIDLVKARLKQKHFNFKDLAQVPYENCW